jgi:hypothetical protein
MQLNAAVKSTTYLYFPISPSSSIAFGIRNAQIPAPVNGCKNQTSDYITPKMRMYLISSFTERSFNFWKVDADKP